MTKRIVLSFLVVLLSLNLLHGKSKIKVTKTTDNYSNFQLFDANNILMPVENNGNFAGVTYENNQLFSYGLEYNGTNFIYASGLWIAAKVDSSVRASISLFSTDFTRGIIDENGDPFGADDSLRFRVYKINKGDTPETNPDYAEWPIEFGAPVDEQGNPQIFGDQTLWCTFTDAYDSNRWFNSSPPLKAEIHLTVWGWQEIDNLVFLHWDIINKSENEWRDAYVGIFVDPDVGDVQDDLVGSDSTLNVVYCYESTIREFEKTLQTIGYQFLATPTQPSPEDTAVTFRGMKPGYKNVPASSPLIFKHGPWEWSENVFYPGDKNVNILIYDRLNCLDKNRNPMIDPETGKVSRWGFSGNPITSSGWLDPVPHDRRMMIAAGPFDLAPLDTNGITLAIIPVQSDKRLSCIFNLKQQAAALTSAFKSEAGIYIPRIIASAEDSVVSFPVEMINTNEIKKIGLRLKYPVEDIEIDSIHISERLSDFLLEEDTKPDIGETTLCFTATSTNLLSGKGEIFNIKFRANENIISNSDTVKIRDITITDAQNNRIKISETTGIIKFEKLPEPPQLLTPSVNQYVDGLHVDFSWTNTVGSDSNIYMLSFINGYWGTKISSDTSISLPIKDFVFSGSEYIKWTVSIVNYSRTIFSPDTFQFYLPPQEQLEFSDILHVLDGKVYDDDNNWRLCGYDFKMPYVYIISDVFSPQGDFLESYLTVGEFVDYGCKIKNYHHLNISWFSPYDDYHFLNVIDDYAYIYTSDLYTYEISYYQHFDFLKSFELSEPHPYLIYNDYIIVINSYYNAPYKLRIYRIQTPDNIYQIKEYELTDWKPLDNKLLPEQSRIAIKDDYLYVALGDWGIFDFSNPDSLKLLCKIDIDGMATAVTCENNMAYVGNNNNTIFVYNVTDKKAPQLIYSEYLGNLWNYLSPIDKLEIVNGYLYFTNSHDQRLMVCHYEPDNCLLLDKILDLPNLRITKDEIWGVWNNNRILVYRNELSTPVSDNQKFKPSSFNLFQNYPNPFNPTTMIKFALDKPALVHLKIFNIMGQEVVELLNRQMNVGNHSVYWDGKSQSGRLVGSGIYFARLTNGEKSKMIKMVIIR